MDERNGRSLARWAGRLSTLPRRDAPVAPSGVALSLPAVAGIGATFLLMGLVVSSYGPLLALLTRRFSVGLAVAGAILSVHFAGGVAGVLFAMRMLARRPGRDTVMAGLAVGASGSLLAAFAPAWPVFLASIAVVGFGYGLLLISLNQLVAYSSSNRSTALLNGLNGAYSGGAVIGPIVAATFGAAHFSLLFGLAGLGAAMLVIPAARVSGRLPVTPGSHARPGPLVGIFVVAYVLYVGIEVGAGGWMASHLESIGFSAQAAATVTSGFFLALVSGRCLSALIPPSTPEWVVVLSGSLIATVGLLAASMPAIAPAAYLVSGLALAPIFPTGVAWLARLRPGDARATSWLFPAGAVGGVVGPGVIGIVIGVSGVRSAPAVLGAAAVLMTGTFFLARRSAA